MYLNKNFPVGIMYLSLLLTSLTKVFAPSFISFFFRKKMYLKLNWIPIRIKCTCSGYSHWIPKKLRPTNRGEHPHKWMGQAFLRALKPVRASNFFSCTPFYGFSRHRTGKGWILCGGGRNLLDNGTIIDINLSFR